MNKHILTLAGFSIFPFNADQLISMNFSDQEQFHFQLNEQLLAAAKAGDSDGVISLLERGADVNHTAISDYYNSFALMRAAIHGHATIVKILLEHDVCVNQADRIGNTALMYAATHGHTDIVGMLIEHGLILIIPATVTIQL